MKNKKMSEQRQYANDQGIRIILSGGGTAGHINPALAIAGYVRTHVPNAQILYVGASGRMEERLVAQAGFDFKGMNISGFCRDLGVDGIKKNLITLKRIVMSISESRRILKEFNPNICVGTGGYVSGPILHQASQIGIPIVIHEQNAYPGVTTKLLANKAEWVMLALEDASKYFNQKNNVVVTGNPVRREILTSTYVESRKKLGLDDRPVILSFGGSLGAEAINHVVACLIADTAKTDEFQHIHAYGQNGQNFLKAIKDKGVRLSEHNNIMVSEYINDMATCLAASDLVICRAGAITLSEIQVQGKASILIPSPYVAENHQYHNAMALVKAGAAGIIEEKDLQPDVLIAKVKGIVQDKKKLKRYSQNAKDMAILGATEQIFSIIKNTYKRSP